MELALWFFLWSGIYSSQVVGPFKSQEQCEQVRAATNEQSMWAVARPCYLGWKR